MTDCMKSIQSVGRGFLPGIEIKMVSGSSDVGKSVFLDIESDDFKPSSVFRPHYTEYFDYDTGETYWKKFNRLPKAGDMYRANNVIRKNEDGSYEYVKNRQTGGERPLTEQEVIWLILKAGA